MLGYIHRKIGNIIAELRRRRVVNRAFDLSAANNYSDAAELYSEYAATLIGESPLLYCLYSCYSLEEWIKAERPDEALVQARNVLRCLAANDGDLLKYNSGEFADRPLEMATRLLEAGHVDEAETFARELNGKLEEFNVPIRCVLDPTERNFFPVKCESCGGALPPSTHQESINCPFCRTTIYAN